MCVVSKTNVISAEALANKISYPAPITYQEANIYSKEAFLQVAPMVDPEAASKIRTSMIIGASLVETCAIYTLVLTILLIFVA